MTGGALSVFCGGGMGELLGESVRYQELGDEEPFGGGLRGGFKGSLFVLEVIAGLAVESGAFVARVLFLSITCSCLFKLLQKTTCGWSNSSKKNGSILYPLDGTPAQIAADQPLLHISSSPEGNSRRDRQARTRKAMPRG